MKWNEKPLTGLSKALFDSFKPSDPVKQKKNIEDLKWLAESKTHGCH